MNIVLKTILERPGKVLLSFSIVLIIAVLATGMIKFEKDIFKVLPQNSLTFKVLIHSFKTSSSQDKLYLLIRGKNKFNDGIHQRSQKSPKPSPDHPVEKLTSGKKRMF